MSRMGPYEVDAPIPCGNGTKWISVAAVVDTNIYTAGDNVGGKLTFANAARLTGGSGMIQSIVVVDQDNEKAEMDVLFFHTDPAASTITNNVAQDIADADLLNCVGYVNVPAAAFKSAADNAVACVNNIGIPFQLATGATSLYAIAITRGTPTYTATTDIQVSLGILQD